MKTTHLIAWACIVALTWSSAGLAQDAPAEAAAGVDLGEDEAEGEATDLEDEGEDFEQDTEEGQSLDPATAEELAEEVKTEPAKFLLGARYRIMVVPQFLINAFGVEGGRTIVLHGGGPEFGFSQEKFEILLSAWFAGYALEPTPFKAPSDPPDAFEIVQSNLSAAYISGDFLWKQKLVEKLDFHIGVGAGVGIVFGDLYRNEAYFPDPNNRDPYTGLAYCTAPGVPSPQCPLGEYMANGPSEFWPVYPWLTFQTGLRYEVSREFITRLDLGAGSSGFWFGLGADYGL